MKESKAAGDTCGREGGRKKQKKGSESRRGQRKRAVQGGGKGHGGQTRGPAAEQHSGWCLPRGKLDVV